MPFKPTAPSPYMTSIDLTADAIKRDEQTFYKFSCMVNPRDIIDAYCFELYEVVNGEVQKDCVYRQAACRDDYRKFDTYDMVDESDTALYNPLKGYSSTSVSKNPSEVSASFYELLPANKFPKPNELYHSPLPFYGGANNEFEIYVPKNYPYYGERYSSKNGYYMTIKVTDGYISAHPSIDTLILQPALTQYMGSSRPKDEAVIFRSLNYSVHNLNTYSTEYVQYAWKIKLYTRKNTITSGTYNWECSESPLYYFTVHSTPNISMNIYGLDNGVLNTSVIDMTTEYSQGENVDVAYYSVKLYHNGRIIDETSTFYQQDIKYRYIGLVSGESYKLELTLTDIQKKEFIQTVEFTSKYEILRPVNPITTEYIDSTNAIKINYSSLGVLTGKQSDRVVYDVNTNTGILDIKNDYYISWNLEETFQTSSIDNSSFFIKYNPSRGYSDNVFSKYGADSVVVYHSKGKFYLKHNDDIYDIDFYKYEDDEYVKFDMYDAAEVSAVTQNTTYDPKKIYVMNDSMVCSDNYAVWENDELQKYWWIIYVDKSNNTAVAVRDSECEEANA